MKTILASFLRRVAPQNPAPRRGRRQESRNLVRHFDTKRSIERSHPTKPNDPQRARRQPILSLLLATLLSFPLLAQSPNRVDAASVSAQVAPGDGHLILEARGVLPESPLFFSATASTSITPGTKEITAIAQVTLRVLQGRPDVLTLGLSGEGEIIEVRGPGLQDWSVRQEAGKRYLDLRPKLEKGSPTPRDWTLTVKARLAQPTIPGQFTLPVLTAGNAVGFANEITISPGEAVDVRVAAAEGLVPVRSQKQSRREQRFFGTGDILLAARLLPRGSALSDAELFDVELTGKLDEAARCVRFLLRGEARVREAGTRIPLLSGNAALSGATSGDGWHAELRNSATELVFERAGTFPLELAFVAGITEGPWTSLDFRMPAGAVVPMILEGLPKEVAFNPNAAVVPDATTRKGFLAANGNASVEWRQARDAGTGALSFTTQEISEVRLGAGLLRQTSQFDFRILQGRLPSVRLRLNGPGEILGVEGPTVLGWKVVPDGSQRLLEVQLSRPFDRAGTLVVRSQSPLGNFPVKAAPLQLTPEGGVRHSGLLRITSEGAVRLEVSEATGLMQLAPAQFPGPSLKNPARQVFVYRFPSANYTCRIDANQILPEVSVSQIVLYQLAETDRVISADLELDIREAPLREWAMRIPEGYAVVSASGASVADYVAESETQDGSRVLKFLFTSSVEGRQLIRLRLEKNQASAAGEWMLPALIFPGAKSVRGHIGVVSTPGFRILPGTTEHLTELPLNYFPNQMPGLQQTYRQREPDWSATVKIEALGQNVQADVFHLYSLKEGVVHGSVLLNYFVVGAPATELRIEVPESAGNIDVIGQNVRRDWRQEGNQLIVSLHQPVLGPATLLVTFEQPMSARGGTIRPGEVRPLGVQSERGYVQVVSPLQVKSQILKAEGSLLKMEPLELPAEFRVLSSSPSLAVYQYIARPFALEMDVQWFTPAETVDQLVDFAQLSSRVSRDGQIITEARYFVKTRGRKALRLVLPEGVKLWEVRADHATVNAQIDGDQTLIPLPPKLNPMDVVEVVLRLGQTARHPRSPELATPRTQAPTVLGEWTVRGDAGQLLVPKSGTAQLVRPALTETGFEWISARTIPTLFLLLGLAAAGVLLRTRAPWKMLLGFLLSAILVILSLNLALAAARERRPNLAQLTYSATVVPAGENVTLQIGNVGAVWAMISPAGLCAAAAGIVLLAMAAFRIRIGRTSPIWQVPAGALLLALGILAQHGGAIFFFLLTALGIFSLLMLPAFAGWMRRPKALIPPGAAAATSLFLLFASPMLLTPAHGAPAESIVQDWKIREGRLFGELEMRVRGEAGDSFLLLRPTAVLTGFRADQGVRINKVERNGETEYFVALEKSGAFQVRATFESPATDLMQGLPLVSGPAAAQRLTVQLDQSGWDFTSPAAVSVQPLSGLPENTSGATLVLKPSGTPVIQLQSQKRNTAAEKTRFFAEASNLFVPGPGVVNGFGRVTIRPVQGQVSSLELEIPKGFTVGDVRNGPVSAWRFDPATRKLRVDISPAQSANFKFDVETQLGTADLPVNLTLDPVRILGAEGEVGMMGLAFGNDAQPENVRGTSPINLEDFDASLIPTTKDGQPLALLQQAFRYGRDGGTVTLRVAAVDPEVRAITRQVLSFGDDRLVLAADLNVAITRAGLFKLSLLLPEGLEVEAISGSALSQWTESVEDGKRLVTLHLNGRTLGDISFALTFVGAAPAPQDAWPVPHLSLREATRQTGELFLVPEKGIRLRATKREGVSQMDARAAGETKLGALAFRLLQENWTLQLGIEALEPWVTVHALQEVTLREGQTLTRLALRYRVDNAAVKQLRLRLPGLTENQLQTVRGSGPAVNDLVPIPGEKDLWEIRFQRGIVGETDVQIEYQGQTARDQGRETLLPPVFESVRQVTQFVSVRGSGRIELDAGPQPRGWQRVDWSSLPAHLQNASDRSIPALCFRVAEPDGPLTIDVRRHNVADALKLRVTCGSLTTLFSPQGPSLTAMELTIDVVEQNVLRVLLPDHARLFSVFVNDTSVNVVREGDAYLLNVSPNTDTDPAAKVRLVYSVPEASPSAIELTGPRLNIPLVNVSWRVIVPPGLSVSRHRGNLSLKETRAAGLFGLDDYVKLAASTRDSKAKKAAALIDQANSLLQQGEQEKAGEMLSQAAQGYNPDDASNEDARVQLKALKTQQAVVGLNTRRQRLYLDNRGHDAARNEQLEQAVNANPFIQGRTDFNPREMDQLLQGNTAEENSALRGIAGRIVDLQLGAEPAPSAIDVTIPESGNLLTFTRSIQVDGETPLHLKLTLGSTRDANPWTAALILLATAATVAVVVPRQSAV
jgi:Amino acid transporters